MSQIYRVQMTVNMVVMADDETDAEDLARYHIREADGEAYDAETHASPIKRTSDIPSNYSSGSYPWGGDGKQTIAELLSRSE